jgi:hypothetical protein
MKTRRFRVKPPQQDAEPFEARIELDPLRVVSNRSGEWADDPKLNFYDLIMPEQGPLYEWDVEKLADDDDDDETQTDETETQTATDDKFLPQRHRR